jgi:asparagine synthase (glutamine-hydrolysing)
MCGVHGFCWKDTDEAISRMAAIAQHRGPDGMSFWGNEQITLGHNLLAITSKIVTAKQPWLYGDYVLVFNGEIYNYRRLRKSLSGQFTTDSDVEVLAAGLAQVGSEFLYRVDGMFALAFYNRITGDLLLARDSNGSKPLYYGRRAGKLAFSSEIASLLSLGFPRRVSQEGFKHYYHSGLVAGRLTMFDGIEKLVPGEMLQTNVTTGREQRTNLNNQKLAPFAGNPAELPGLLQTRLFRAVEATTACTKPMGLFLSGGMDSGAILYEMRKNLRSRALTFSTRFALPHHKCQHNNDANVAAKLAQLYGTRHQEILITEDTWLADFEKTILALEEPRQGKSYSAYYATNRLLRKAGVVVTLSGDGGDELLMGYAHQHNFPFELKLAALRAGHRELQDTAKNITAAEQSAYLHSWLPKGGLTGDAINDFMYTECLHTLSEDFLIRNDKLGMAFGMEARFPMLSKLFRDFVRSIPSAFKHNVAIAQSKQLLRAAYRNRLPEIVVGKRKTGWRAPTDDWIIGIASHPAPDSSPIRDYIRSTLADPLIREVFELTEDDIENRYLNNKEHFGTLKRSGKSSTGIGLKSQKELFTVLTFAVWFKQFNMSMW